MPPRRRICWSRSSTSAVARLDRYGTPTARPSATIDAARAGSVVGLDGEPTTGRWRSSRSRRSTRPPASPLAPDGVGSSRLAPVTPRRRAPAEFAGRAGDAIRRPTAPRSPCSWSPAPTTTPSPARRSILTGYGGFAIPRRRRVRRRIAAWSRPAALYAVAGSAAAPRRARRGTAPAARAQAAGVRRLPRRRRLARRRRVHVPRAAGDPRRLQRRAARRRGHHATARPVPGRALRGAAARHGALPAVPHRPAVDREYGDPDEAEEFEWLHGYSPYHHVSTTAPATRRCC